MNRKIYDCDDEKILEDDEELRRSHLLWGANRYGFASEDVDNDYEDTVGFADGSDLVLSW